MFNTKVRRIWATAVVFGAVGAAMLTSKAVLIVGLGLCGIAGVAALGLWSYDWINQPNEDEIAASREQQDRRHARFFDDTYGVGERARIVPSTGGPGSAH